MVDAVAQSRIMLGLQAMEKPVARDFKVG